MAGAVDSIGPGSSISNESSSADPVSTVDNADTESGQIMVVQALRLPARRQGRRSSYGIDAGNGAEPGRPRRARTPTGTVPATGAGGH